MFPIKYRISHIMKIKTINIHHFPHKDIFDRTRTIFLLWLRTLPVREHIGVRCSDKRGISDCTDVSTLFSKRTIFHVESTGASLPWIPNHRNDCLLPGSVYNARGMTMTEKHLLRQRKQPSHQTHSNVIIIWLRLENWNSYHFRLRIIPTSFSPESCALSLRERSRARMYTTTDEPWFLQTALITSKASYATMMMILWSLDIRTIFRNSNYTDIQNCCSTRIASCLSKYSFFQKIIFTDNWTLPNTLYLCKQKFFENVYFGITTLITTHPIRYHEIHYVLFSRPIILQPWSINIYK